MMNSEFISARRSLSAAAIVLIAAIIREPDEPRRAAVQFEARTPDELAMTLALADDVWTDEVSPRTPVVAVFSPRALGRLRDRGVPFRIVDANLDATAVAERRRLVQRARRADWFAEYRDADEIDARMTMLATHHPELATLRLLGTSLEGRPIRALEISRGGTRKIVIDGGHHGREWIAVMVPMCIADRLVGSYDRDPRIRRILDSVTFVIAPLVNPDGYAYTWTTDRYWRKNRRGGYGVDLSRNYSVAWGGAGSSGDKQSPNYRGESAFSEPETRAVRDMFEQQAIAAHVDFHSFSQVIAYPWSHQRAEPEDEEAFAVIAGRMSTAMRAAHDHKYSVRPGSEFKTSVSGTAIDWSYGEHGALSFLVELRPASSAGGGFVIPPDQIAPTCDEAMAGILELAEWTITTAR